MIDRIIGQVIAHTDNNVTVMVGGVGLLLHVPRNVTSQLSPGEIELFTHLAVREDSLTLYGFGSQQERDIFEALIKVNGVGPRLGIAVLSTLSVDHLRDAVARENPDVLVAVPGIGKKTAQKMVLELKDRIGWTLGLDAAPIVADVDTDVLATLTELGYSIVEAQSAIQTIPPDAPDDIEERLRLALKYFA